MSSNVIRRTDWATLVLQADPEHARLKRYQVEYEFQAQSGGKPQTHENGYRVFKGNYDQRGPYSDE